MWKKPITIEEMVQVIFNAYKELVETKERTDADPYLDHFEKFLQVYFKQKNKERDKNPSSWAKESWKRFLNLGWCNGDRPLAWATKEEVVTMLCRIYLSQQL